jgi:hypothetical protein
MTTINITIATNSFTGIFDSIQIITSAERPGIK